MSNISRSSGNGTSQACAACKYQRRKCAPDCILAPYFPHDRQRQFQNAHKLFGVSNITKIIKSLNPPDKDIAMGTIVFQSNARAADPVGGCLKIIQELQRQIEYSQAEMDLVFNQLAICRQQQSQLQQQMQMQEPATGETSFVNTADPLNNYYQCVQDSDELQFTVNNDDTNHKQHLQDSYDSWVVQESTTTPLNMKQSFIKGCDEDEIKADVVDQIPHCERHEIKFDPEGVVERRIVSSTQLVMSS